MIQNEVAQRVEQALNAMREGKFVILVDDEDRENEGDLVIAATKVTPQDVNFMTVEARGLICLAMASSEIERLGLAMMVTQNGSPYGTAFTVSIEAREGVTTGISAADRAQTIRVASNPESTSADIISPGHVFPLKARDGGVLVRTGQTEGSVDLARLAGLPPSAVICEIMNQDGTMSRMPDLEEFGKKHGIMILSVADLIAYRLERESLVTCVMSEKVDLHWSGDWKIEVYRDDITGTEHVAFVCGEPSTDKPAMIRVQHRVDAFAPFDLKSAAKSLDGLDAAMKAIAEHGNGVFVYLDRESESGSDWLKRYLNRDNPPKGVAQKDLRQLGIGSQILKKIGVGDMIVLTNRPKHLVAHEAYGLNVVEQRSFG